MASVHRRAAARRDLIAHAVHLAENAGEGIAERFLDEAEATFEALAAQPTMGAPLTLRRPELAGLRKLPSRRIARVLFCLVDSELVVLHGFIKKTQKTPSDDLGLAHKRRKEIDP